MNPEVKSSLLWGVVGGLAFLVLLQGYQLLADQLVSVELVAGVAVVVGTVTAAGAQLLRPRLRARNVE